MAVEQKNLNEKNARHSYEYLKLINEADSDLKKVELLKKWGDKPPLDMLLSLNFNHKIVLDLPEGAPPYKRNEETHPDMLTPLASQIQRLKSCVKSNPMKKVIKERTFIQVIEMIPPKEADVLVACKDHTLEELYPNVTKELVKTVFPHYVSE